MLNRTLFQLLSFVFTISATLSASALDVKTVEAALAASGGTLAEVHGANHERGQYVLSFRHPTSFFDYLLVSMLADEKSPGGAAVAATMKSLKRNDIVRVHGRLNTDIKSPQPHAFIDEVTVVAPFANPYPAVPAYQSVVNLEKELAAVTEADFKVHAVLESGKILVLEYGDSIVPTYVSDPAQAAIAKELYRGDIVHLKFKIAADPTHPLHLRLQKVPDAIALKDKITEQHGKPVSLCGTLAMFPKSPLITINVFALQLDVAPGINRTYTLVNFDDMAEFAKIRDNAQKVWDRAAAEIVSARNYFLNPHIKVCAKGTGNIQDPSQANPQILLEKADDLTF